MYGEEVGLLSDLGVLEHDALRVEEVPAYDPNCLGASMVMVRLPVVIATPCDSRYA